MSSTTISGGKGERKTKTLLIKPKREVQFFIINSLGRLVKVELKKTLQESHMIKYRMKRKRHKNEVNVEEAIF